MLTGNIRFLAHIAAEAPANGWVRWLSVRFAIMLAGAAVAFAIAFMQPQQLRPVPTPMQQQPLGPVKPLQAPSPIVEFHSAQRSQSDEYSLRLALKRTELAPGSITIDKTGSLSLVQSVTERVSIVELDHKDRSVTFQTPSGQLLKVPVDEKVSMGSVRLGSPVSVTYTEVLTLIAIRAPVAVENGKVDDNRARVTAAAPPSEKVATLVVANVDNSKSIFSAIDLSSGAIRTYLGNNTIADKGLLNKFEAGASILLLRTPVVITAITEGAR